jgi:hypothetical protein
MEDHHPMGIITMADTGAVILVGLEIPGDLIPGAIGITNALIHIIRLTVCRNLEDGSLQLGRRLMLGLAHRPLQTCGINSNRAGMTIGTNIAVLGDAGRILGRGLLTVVTGTDVTIHD